MRVPVVTNNGGGAAGGGLAANQSEFKVKVTSHDGQNVGGRKITFTDARSGVTEVNTDSNGRLSVILSPGTYTIAIQAPNTYEQPSTQTITADGGVSYDVEFHMYSNVNPVTVRLSSFDNAGINGLTLTVKNKATTATVGTYTFTSNGVLNFNLASGTYTFEVSGNSTRYVTPTAQERTLSRGSSATLDFALATNVGTINVAVTSFNGSGISGVVLHITKDGSEVTSATLTAAGTHTIDLNPGTYVLSLTGIKQGYDQPANQTVVVSRGGTYNVSFFIPERSQVIYGVRITKSNNSPTHLVYTDDASGFSPSTMTTAGVCTDNGWTARLKELFGMKPCLLKNGVLQYYLNENNFNQKADGSASVLTGADGDVMMEFTRNGWVSITNDSSYIYVRVSNLQVDSTYQQLAWSYKGVKKDKFYIGVYKGYLDGSKLRSISGKTPTANRSITQFVADAHANGAGYELVRFDHITFLQVLYLLRFKSLDGQTAVGKGYTGASAAAATGTTNDKGLNYGTNTNNATTSHVKVNGIEDFWGNIWEWTDGIFCDSSRNVRTGDKDIVSASNGTGFTTRTTISADIGGWISDVHATNELGFLIKAKAGSETTYYCDYGYCYAGYVGRFGGRWTDGTTAGPFRFFVSSSLSDTHAYIGARLAWCGM